jgi:Winged helix DNA-binding domain
MPKSIYCYRIQLRPAFASAPVGSFPAELSDLATRRLHAQRLVGQPFASPVEAVRELGAVQSQDYGAARWALHLRTGAPAAEIDRLFDEGAILRTHVLRPTWHFLVPEVLDRLLQLTGPRIRAGLGSRHRNLELDLPTVKRAGAIFVEALADGRSLTRAELGAILAAEGIRPDGQRLPHLLLCAELDRLITSGPRRGRQFTWMSFEARARHRRPFDPEEAATTLALTYFRSHGPAQLQDFCWWSGLNPSEGRRAVRDAAAIGLAREVVDGKEHWFAPGAERAPRPHAGVHLLANYDEYLVAYRDRSAALDRDLDYDPAFFPFGSILGNVILVGGRVWGAWRKTASGVEPRVLRALSPDQRRALDAAAEAAGAYFSEAV